LEDQVAGPVNEHREFDMSPDEVIGRLKTIPRYNELSNAAYQQDISFEIVQKALANFERIIAPHDVKFDQYMNGEVALTAEEQKGWELFQSPELNCVKCHSGYNFTNYSFQNNGLYATYADSGRALITGKAEDLAKFKVPSLRNVVITYPYMHNGSISTLEEVIDHYASGGKGHPSQSHLIQGFTITPNEKQALIAFLGTLTDGRYLVEEE
jgi:cytochrome c peroxidase